jgi:probable 2-oxoglutarate dehydrogenase E1 component DHKTD1
MKASSSSLVELDEGTAFKPVIQDPLADPSKTKRIVLLTGKLYYDLIKERETRNLVDEVSFVRIEELAPFPFTQLRETLELYDQRLHDVEICWVQEEARNQGAWGHVKERVESVLGEMGLDLRRNWLGYKGRRESAIPAPGIGKVYQKQQREVLESVFADL